MEYLTPECPSLPVSVQLSRFVGPSGVAEYHVMASPTRYGSFDEQLGWLRRAEDELLTPLGLNKGNRILRRLFCSDLCNQAHLITQHGFINGEDGALSLVGQPPAAPAKVALWSWHISDPKQRLQRSFDTHTLAVDRGTLTHYLTTGLQSGGASTSAAETTDIFSQYEAFIARRGMTTADQVMRTWLFVRDIDVNYKGMVVARREFFAQRGLTPETHYIASSGIESAPATGATVVMDAYAISGIKPEQVTYLHALEHLSPTHVYGVTFERGVAIAYRDRRHIYLSGTASIDSQGHIVHPGDVDRQLDRTLENMEALLAEAGASLKDMASFIVYLRDPADMPLLRQRMAERLGNAPAVYVAARVCRPGWLVEIEGQATVAAGQPDLPLF